MPDLQILELQTDQQIEDAFDLMAVMRTNLKREEFVDSVRLLELDGYRLLGGFVEGQIVALAGVRRANSLARGAYAFVNDLVTHPEHRGRGYATQLLWHIAKVAVEQGLGMVCLNSYPEAWPFYEKLKFEKSNIVPCWIDARILAQDGGHDGG